MHFSKQFVQTAPHNRLPAKACNLLNIFSSSLKSKYMSINISVPSEWKVLVSLFTNKMLSHVVNVTVHSVSFTWCKLWQQFGWQLLKCRRLHFLCMPYILSKVQIYTLVYVGYWLKETVSKFLNYWGCDRVQVPEVNTKSDTPIFFGTRTTGWHH